MSNIITNFAILNPAMRGASEEERHRALGGHLIKRKALLTLYFLALRNDQFQNHSQG